ncbi:MAG: methionine--tRNA ligase, partial [Myxococcales bacterium]|nr:methionine--tRNA ligase [Myxococcales bacterium]
PIYYVNDKPHIGHAYTSVAADVLARWHRALGDDTWFLTGTDEHGLKIEQAARKAGVTPQQHADRFAEPFRALTPALLLSNDDTIRTTEARHSQVVSALWRKMVEAGDIYLGTYAGWYSVGDEAYFDESEIVDGKAPSGHAVEWVEEHTYFFRLSKYGPLLLEYFEAHPDFVKPSSRFNEVKRFVEGGLKDLSLSRTTFNWGIPVPDADGHVIYVWMDALTNYVSALGGPGADKYDRFWPASVHLIGKDILRFHAVYWPAFLMSAGLPLPQQVFAHGWWTVEGQKMSKSLGNTIDPFDVVQRFGAEAFRYFLLREVSFGSDGDFSEAGLISRINGELANDFGNLVNRSLGMLDRYRKGVVPARGRADAAEDGPLLQAFAEGRAELLAAMDELAFHKALAAIWKLVGAANKYVDVAAPWTLVKQGDDARLDEVLYNLCEVQRVLGVWVSPFLPHKGPELLDRLGAADAQRTVASTAEWGGLPSGGHARKGDPLFPRIEVEKPAEAPAPKAKKEKAPKAPKAPKAAPKAEAADGVIAYDDFEKLQLKVARVLAAEKHPDADRLLKLSVDAGEAEPRTVCAGIAGAYAPEDLVGQTVVLLANLAPRKIRGVVSQGMLLAAG